MPKIGGLKEVPWCGSAMAFNNYGRKPPTSAGQLSARYIRMQVFFAEPPKKKALARLYAKGFGLYYIAPYITSGMGFTFSPLVRIPAQPVWHGQR